MGMEKDRGKTKVIDNQQMTDEMAEDMINECIDKNEKGDDFFYTWGFSGMKMDLVKI